jgi:hypothetical protein
MTTSQRSGFQIGDSGFQIPDGDDVVEATVPTFIEGSESGIRVAKSVIRDWGIRNLESYFTQIVI